MYSILELVDHLNPKIQSNEFLNHMFVCTFHHIPILVKVRQSKLNVNQNPVYVPEMVKEMHCPSFLVNGSEISLLYTIIKFMRYN